MQSSQKIRIAIAGGGIGGLTLAVALSHLNLEEFIQVDIYESAAKLTQVGAGITLWPRGLEILKSMGLEASLAIRLPDEQDLPSTDKPKLASAMRKSDQQEGIPISELFIPGGSISLHRADLQDVLLGNFSSSIHCHLSHRLSTYRQTENGVELEFKNGKTATCDLLVGADGINSAVRKVFLAEGNDVSQEEETTIARPLWTGTYVYRNLIDSELIRKEAPNHHGLTTPMVYCGKTKHIIAYPIQQGKLINAVAFLTDLNKENTYLDGPAVTEDTTDKFTSQFADWEEEPQILLKHMSKPSRWAIQTVKPLDSYVSGRVILMGDAAHAMAPHLGNGAGQAMEDAYILANILAKAMRQGSVDIKEIANAYDAVRQPFGNFAAASSRNQGLLYELNASGFEDIKDGEALPADKIAELARRIEKNWEWTYQSANNDLEKALAML
ncbi:hypothetical protein GALMADRAFT_136860 [Galerina marginata CBS 339.88]|uniref:FAD-binding domain-containing protein n=1 Tax=Galerina marginata (strain CBS 339.88) TaxID=685588 RepID=A0A067TAY2_GALM3|nr:hypothetical protein GALMADRAFT_136860 [Galerina marginata CBS 339.88]